MIPGAASPRFSGCGTPRTSAAYSWHAVFRIGIIHALQQPIGGILDDYFASPHTPTLPARRIRRLVAFSLGLRAIRHDASERNAGAAEARYREFRLHAARSDDPDARRREASHGH